MKQLIILTQMIFLPALIFAEETEMPPTTQGIWQTIAMIAIAMTFFYFILWRPDQKRRQAMEQLRSSMKKGDKVTAIGIIGTVFKIEENTVILTMYDGNKIEVIKGSITEVVSNPS